MQDFDMFHVVLEKLESVLERVIRLDRENAQLHQELSLLKLATKKTVSEELVRDLLSAAYDTNNKIRQIKAVRELTGAGLKEAKELVEEVRREWGFNDVWTGQKSEK